MITISAQDIIAQNIPNDIFIPLFGTKDQRGANDIGSTSLVRDNVVQDHTIPNVAGWLGNEMDRAPGAIYRKCPSCLVARLLVSALDTPGGQVAHFMRDEGQSEKQAYFRSTERILSEGAEATRVLKQHLDAHNTGSSIFYNSYSDVRAHLGAALHTLQDSFSPAHTKRDTRDNGFTILNIFVYDKNNFQDHGQKDEEWAEQQLDFKASNTLPTIRFTPLGQASVDASAELIKCVFRVATERPAAPDVGQQFRVESTGQNGWCPRFLSEKLTT